MKLLDYIRVVSAEITEPEAEEPEAEEPEDFPESEELAGVREELKSAISQEEEITKLGMDETVALAPVVMEQQPQPDGLEPTEEIVQARIGLDEEEHAGAEDRFEVEEIEEGVVEVDEEEPHGLDDLSEMSGDLLEQELAKMEQPLSEEEEAGEEASPEKEEIEEGEGRKIPRLLLVAASLILIGVLALASSYLLDLFSGPDKPLTSVVNELAALEEATQTPNETSEPSENGAHTEPVTMPVAETTTPQEETDTGPTEPPTQEQPLATAGPAIDADEIDTQNAEETGIQNEPVTPVTHTNTDPVTDEAGTETGEQVTGNEGGTVSGTAPPAQRRATPEERGFHSPIADGWPLNGGPNHREETGYGTDERRRAPEPGWTGVTALSQAAPTRILPGTNPVREKNGKIGSNPRPEPENRLNGGSPVSRPIARSAGSAQALLAGRNFEEAARIWQDLKRNESGKFTIALFMVCERNSVGKAVVDSGGDERLFILPKNFRGKSCYWVCWGAYDLRMQALRDIENLPVDFLAERAGITVYRLQALLP